MTCSRNKVTNLLGGLYFVLGCLLTIVIIVAGMAVVAVVAISAAEIFG